jgi:hypothetical protein
MYKEWKTAEYKNRYSNKPTDEEEFGKTTIKVARNHNRPFDRMTMMIIKCN